MQAGFVSQTLVKPQYPQPQQAMRWTTGWGVVAALAW